jgi:predicted NBD/HSP70 family sugar kinase
MLQRIYRGQPVSRQSLAAQTGLSANRVSTLVTRLLDARLLEERVVANGGLGRPPAELSVDAGLARVVGLDIGGQQSRAALCDSGGRVLAAEVWPTEAVPDREIVLDNIQRLVESVCRKGGTRPSELTALGVGVRAIVDTRRGVVLSFPNTPAWTTAWAGLDVPAEMRRRLGVRHVAVDDSVRTMGLAAGRYGPARSVASYIYVFLGSGIGSAVFLSGQPYVGHSSMAGELGHVAVTENGPWCTCGNRGCLEVIASTSAILRQVKERLAEAQTISLLAEAAARNQLTLAALFDAARAGDKLAYQILNETGVHIGRVMAIALNLLDPELVVVGGPLVHDDGILVEAVRREVRMRALPHISRHIRIEIDDQGAMSGARGAALLALDHIFDSTDALVEMLTGRIRRADA